MTAAKTTGSARPESARSGAAPHGTARSAGAKPPSDAERGRFKPFLSERMRQVLRARLQEMAGFLLGLLALAIFALLASYAPSDPSLNTAGSGGEIKNWLGAPGALVADLMRQTLGYAAYLFVIIPIAWGWRLGAHRPLRRPLRRAVTAL
ncbi:MAG TPA: DNA translocase FtsK 4TM domain-containing protein, partial [Azospirillaceae bacterium]|nr:DNA translocase FtsK 4TM domain-containing protein [Azospirillaceae bacterium]